MSFKDDWNNDRARKRHERDVAQFMRRMSSPVARGEVFQLGEAQAQHIASLALALEALEDILVGCGVLEPDELMSVMDVLARRKAEQAQAAAAVSAQPSLIATV